MGKIFLWLFVATCVSFYLFPFGFTFLPAGINTKNLMALLGVPLLGIKLASLRDFKISKKLLGAVGLASAFSLVCLAAVDYNATEDFSYASYIVSFTIWMLGAFTTSEVIRRIHGDVNFKIVVAYLAFVCVAQCCLALVIDRNMVFQLYVNTYIDQGQEFLVEVDRLYGIGASLDPAGVRFAVVLTLIAALVTKERDLREDTWSLILFLLAFLVISAVGNMISRTTTIGVGVGLVYFLVGSGVFKLVFRKEYFKFYLIFSIILLLSGLLIVYFYNTDKNFYQQFRFAFEGFFNWVEKGEFRTSSTDKLNREMWIWPSDTKTWIIGSGLFDNWIYGTDIGYCRFILYCGLTGFSLFALFFIYNATVFGMANPEYRDLFFVLGCITFIVWIKVSTDIFQFYALFYCLDYFTKPRSTVVLSDEYEEQAAVIA